MLPYYFLGFLVIADGFAEPTDGLKHTVSLAEYSLCPVLCKDWSTPFYSKKDGGCVTMDSATTMDDELFCPDLETIKTWTHYEAFLSERRMSKFWVYDVLMEMIDIHERNLTVNLMDSIVNVQTKDSEEKRLQESDAIRRRWFWPKRWFVTCGNCGHNQYKYRDCSHFSSRKCATCRRCSSNEYEIRSCGGSRNRVCAQCTTCASNYYETRSCTGNTNRVCSRCRSCSSIEYESQSCSGTRNRVCSRCSTCSSGNYQSRICSGRSNTICSSCTECSDSEYETRSCSSTHDRTCKTCTTCNTNEYEARKCYGTVDRLCLSCTECKENEYEVSKCSKTKNRVCALCKTCQSNEFQTGTCSRTKNSACALCKTCASNQYVSTRCSKTHDTVCANCKSSCTSNEYESTACSLENDRVCSTCSSCKPGEFMSKSCTNSTNTVCLSCSTCQADEFLVQKCSETKDTVCLKINLIFEKRHLDDLFQAAFEIVVNMTGCIVDFSKAFRNIYMALMNPDHSCEQIILDVGGRLFNTSISTLRSISGTFFEKMFCEGANTTISGNGTYLIDRDPSAFEYILDYLRSGDMLVEIDDVNFLMQLLDDAEYFELPSKLRDYLRWFSMTGINLWFSEYAFLNEQLKNLSKEIGGLLFQASKDGDDVSTFHRQCDDRGPSVIIVETKSGNMFGGYTYANWSSSAGYSVSTGAFLFRLRPSKRRYDQRNTSTAYAIHCHSNHGPVFGNGHTLFINNCMDVATCYVKNTGYNISSNYELNAGEQYFRIKDYAVLQARALQLF